MKKNFFLGICAISTIVLFFLMGFYSTTANQNSNQNKKNIIYIMLDDADYHDVMGLNSIPTPNIDNVRDNSLVFTSLRMAPQCSPTRTALLSGDYQARYGIQWVYSGISDRGIPNSKNTLVDILNTQGYETVHVGKWHAGKGDGYEVWDQGFDHVRSNGSIGKYGYINLGNDCTDGNPICQYIAFSDSNKVNLEEKDHLTDTLTDHAIDFLTGSLESDEPIFLNLWYNAPHFGNAKTGSGKRAEASAQYLSGAISDVNKKHYSGLVAQVDYNIGRILDTVNNTPELRDNTIIFITSDNGGREEDRPEDEDRELTGFKTDLYEGGVRLPLIVYQHSGSGVINDSVISVQDILPTIAEISGYTGALDTDGKSFANIINGKSNHFNPTRKLYGMHKVHKGGTYPHSGNTKLSRSVFDPLSQHKLIFDPEINASSGSTTTLYDLGGDSQLETTQNDIGSGSTDLIDSLENDYFNWKFGTTRIPVIEESTSGNVSSNNGEYQFGTGSSTVTFEHNDLQNIIDMDFAFSAKIHIDDTTSNKHQRIIYKQGSWILKYIPNTQTLRYTLVKTTSTGTVYYPFDIAGIETGKDYDIAFSITGTPEEKGILANVYTRENGNASFTVHRNFLNKDKMDQVYGNTNKIILGSPDFVGNVKNIHMFTAPIEDWELEKIYTSHSPSVDIKHVLNITGEESDAPGKLIAGRRSKIRWETQDVHSCTILLEYKEFGSSTGSVLGETARVDGNGIATIDRVKGGGLSGLEKIELLCEDYNGNILSDSINIELWDNVQKNLYINDNPVAESLNIIREDALSICLDMAIENINSSFKCSYGNTLNTSFYMYTHDDNSNDPIKDKYADGMDSFSHHSNFQRVE